MLDMPLGQLRQLVLADARQDVEVDVLAIGLERAAFSGIGLDALEPLVSDTRNSQIAGQRHMRSGTDRNLHLVVKRHGFTLMLEPPLMPSTAAIRVVCDPPQCFDLFAF